MSEVYSDRNNPWPFIGITVLVLLLAAFLYLRMARKNDSSGPIVAPPPSMEEKEELPVVAEKEEVVAPESPSSPGTGAKESLEQENPEETRAALVTKAREALSNQKFDEALSAISEARKIRAGDDLEGLQKEVVQAREELAKQQEARDRFAVDFLEISRLWEKEWKKKNLWEAALRRIEAFEKKHSLAAKDPDYQALQKMIVEAHTDYSRAYKKNVTKARNFQGVGNTTKALAQLRIALSLFPEREPEVRKLREEWESIVHNRNMIRVSDVAVQIGDDRHEGEKPVRSFKGKVFWIDQYEVTNEDYAAFLIANPEHRAPPPWRSRKPPRGMEKHPVTFVTLADAEAYARWAKKRLPTADEWEKAARFLKGGVWPWGDTFPPPGSDEFFANSLEYWQRFKERAAGPMAVGSFPKGRGELDLYDMAGNVWEWTSTRVTVEEKGVKVERAVLKGGSFMTSKGALRCSNRLLDAPILSHPDTGFRCVRD